MLSTVHIKPRITDTIKQCKQCGDEMTKDKWEELSLKEGILFDELYAWVCTNCEYYKRIF
ncbi:hypothetical protein BpOF4_06050 [Alkalihalophilus pseudofirmus OF4]|uniref:Uncharacterized protein n=1 Tax=Alkalihalophilus pseudofirmus (strain ATCC BAA-2126 / JCM 17055 / OF4) TaxID=398511 RepID=D3FZN0_ALKPO|nr:hypothetical protein [Alkalihalophilus pseudofirmus]ADC49272.1 hypothetical protein BpOF4_06050 [Alkalihalophilus pseudofirmus OF4]